MIAELRQMEKNVRRLPARVAPVAVDGEWMSNFGPAVPTRMRRAMICGMHAYLKLLDIGCIVGNQEIPFIVMEDFDAECSDNECYCSCDHNPNLDREAAIR